MTYLSAAFLGLVQGLAEFLPISSSGHLAVFQSFFGLTNPEDGNLFFDVLLHLGTLVAVFVAYWSEIRDIIRELLEMVHLKRRPADRRPDLSSRRMILLIIIATIPMVAVLPVKDKVEALYSNTFFIGGALIVTGLILFFSDRLARGRKTIRNATVLDALLVGVGQAVAVVPGISRSGTSISVGMLRGFDRTFAVKFSFLMSIPAVLGANIISLAGAIQEGIDTSCLGMYIVGVIVAMVSGYLAIRFINFIAKRGSFGGFAYYCWGAGIVTLILSLIA